MTTPAIPSSIDYVWTDVDHDRAWTVTQHPGAGDDSYVTPYKVFPWSLTAPKANAAGASVPIALSSVTDQRSYVQLFLPSGFEWIAIPPAVTGFSSIRSLCAALLAFSRDVFPPELYDLALPNRPPPGKLGIEKLLFEHWENSAWRYAASKQSGFDWRSLLDVATTAGGKTITKVLAKEVVSGHRPVAPGDPSKGPQTVCAPPPADTLGYAGHLNAVLEKIKGVAFGRCDGDTTSTFDSTFWETEADKQFAHHLRVKDGKLSHEALDKIAESPDLWSFDCGQFAQVLQMYARLHTLGACAWDKEVKQQILRVLDSPGRGITKEFNAQLNLSATQDLPTGQMLDSSANLSSVEDVLANAPVGSLVVWRKPNEKQPDEEDEKGGPWLNENTIKFGDDKYWAHGMQRHFYDRKTLESEYSAMHTPGPVHVNYVGYVEHPDER